MVHPQDPIRGAILVVYDRRTRVSDEQKNDEVAPQEHLRSFVEVLFQIPLK